MAVKECLEDPSIDLNEKFALGPNYVDTTPLLNAIGTPAGDDAKAKEVREQIALSCWDINLAAYAAGLLKRYFTKLLTETLGVVQRAA